MGIVYSAYDPVLQRTIALKFLRARSVGSSGSLGSEARLLREAQALAKLSHPNVVTILDVGSHDHDVFLAMEFLVGQTLGEWFRQAEHTWQEIVDVMLDAGRGLTAAHRQGLVHRGIKPSNIFLTDDGRVVVMDFGLAQSRAPGSEATLRSQAVGIDAALDTQLTADGEVMGTPSYMSPEQHRGEATGPATDQFGFCVTLYEALYAVRPFAAPTLTRLREAACEGAIQPAQRSLGPRKLMHLVRRGLHPDPERRYPSMDALLGAVRSLRRRRGRAWALASAVGVAAFAGAGATWIGVGASESALCAGAEQRLAGVWDDGRREQIRLAFGEVDKPYAQDTLERILPKLQEYAGEWTNMHRDACEATSVRGEQSAAVLDLRMACLYRARASLTATVGALAAADAGVVQRAHRVVAGLEPLELCTNIEALQSAVEPPSVAERESVEAIVAEVADAEAQMSAGKYDRAGRALKRADILAQQVGYQPVRTGIAVLYAGFHKATGNYAQSEAAAQEAVANGSRWGQRREVLGAAITLMQIVGLDRGEPERALMLHSMAEGVADRSGDPKLRGRVQAVYATVLLRQGKLREAEVQIRQGIAQMEEALGREDPALLNERASLAVILGEQGKIEEAAAEFRQVLEARRRVLGPAHPDVGLTQSNLGLALRKLGQVERAAVEQQEALELLERSHGKAHRYVALGRMNLAATLRKQGNLEQAEVHLRRGYAISKKTLGNTNPDTALLQLHLGDLLLARDRLPEAREHAEAAWAVYRKVETDPWASGDTAFLLARILHRMDQNPRRAKELSEFAVSQYRAAGSVAAEELAKAEAWLAAQKGFLSRGSTADE